MERYNWYVLKEALKRLQVKTVWASSANLLLLRGPKGSAAIRKDNSIPPEMVQFILDKLGIDIAEFGQAHEAYIHK